MSVCSVLILHFYKCRGVAGGTMVLGKLPVPGRPTNLNSCSTKYWLTA